MKLILASSSPRRKELLASMGLSFDVVIANTDEIMSGEPSYIVRENAALKCRAVSAKYPSRPVLGADTIVYLPETDQVLGKPADREDAKRMLRALSGKTHVVYTGICLRFDGKEETRVDCTSVMFDPLSEQAIERYIMQEDVTDKAGAYAMQGAGGMFVRSIEGSPSCVIGLTLSSVRQLLKPFGLIF